jgi:hypothetical protein
MTPPCADPTPASLRLAARRADRRIASTEKVLDALRGNKLLLLEFRHGRASWSLSDGRPVEARVADILINSAQIKPVGRGLFDFAPAQLWKLGGSDDS